MSCLSLFIPLLPVSSSLLNHLRNAVPLGREGNFLPTATFKLSATCGTFKNKKNKGNMATGGFKSNATTDFLEEWKAKREKMRAKMLGDIAAATGAPLGASNTNSTGTSNRHAPPPPPPQPAGAELTNNGNPGNCLPSSYSVARSSSGSALMKRAEEETVTPGSNLKKAPPQMEKSPPCATPDSSPVACNDSDKESPSPGKAKEKNSSGPSARKGKGQIEKRKLREKRRSTGVVSIPSNEVSQVTLQGQVCVKSVKKTR